MAADSTMLRMVKRLIALSLGTQRAQLEQRTGLTWPRPFLLRPLEEVSGLFSVKFLLFFFPLQSLIAHAAVQLACHSSATRTRRHCGGIAGWRREGISYLFALFLTMLSVSLR